MRDNLDFILNLIFGVKFRYRKEITYKKTTNFLKSFSFKRKTKNNILSIGKNCVIGAKFIAEGDNAHFIIGDNVYIGNSKIICRSGIEFGNNILVAWDVTFYDHDSHSLDFRIRKEDIEQVSSDFIIFKGDYTRNKSWKNVKSEPIKICDDAWIGFNSTILKGITIGKGSIVAACAVVTKDVPPFTVVAGNPAKVVKQLKVEN